MSIAEGIEFTAESPESIEAAIELGIERARKTFRNIRSAWVKETHEKVENGAVSAYRVHLRVTFILTD